MRTTIRMNQELARKVKQLATDSGRTFTAVIEEAVADLLARAGTERTNGRITLPVVGDPKGRITEDEYMAAVERMFRNDDLRHIGGS